MARRLAVIGCGAIGSRLAAEVAGGRLRGLYTLAALMDLEPGRCRRLVEAHGLNAIITDRLEELLATEPEVVVEAASPRAVAEYGESVLRSRADLVVMSVSALLDEQLLSRLLGAAGEAGSRILAPSGAVAGLDALKAHRLAGIEELVHRVYKRPEALGLSPGTRGVVYRGPAAEAVKRFPLNLNVTAAIALAAGRPPLVEVHADPEAPGNVHEVEARSPLGRVKVRLENAVDPANPRTSLLAAYSLVALLEEEARPRLRIGT